MYTQYIPDLINKFLQVPDSGQYASNIGKDTAAAGSRIYRGGKQLISSL